MRRLLHFLAVAFVASSCTTDSYEKGEGMYSQMRGDFVEARVNANRQIVSFSTDDGEQLELSEPYTGEWIKIPDTLYRCVLYYNKVGNQKAELLSIGEVFCPPITTLAEFKKELRVDPVKFESMWLSKSGKYLNLYLQLKSGVTDDTTAVQRLALISDTLITNSDQTTIRHITLHHDQNKVPEYYSTKTYLSILTDSIAADSIYISINTYTGMMHKSLPVR